MIKIISLMFIMISLLACDGLSIKPHKTSVTYGIAETNKDNDSKDSIKESFTIKQDFIWED